MFDIVYLNVKMWYVNGMLIFCEYDVGYGEVEWVDVFEGYDGNGVGMYVLLEVLFWEWLKVDLIWLVCLIWLV